MDFVRPTRPVPLNLIGGSGHYASVIEAVMAAETSVWIATANLKELMVEDPRARPGRRRRDRYRSVLEVSSMSSPGAASSCGSCTRPSRRGRFAKRSTGIRGSSAAVSISGFARPVEALAG